MAQILFASLNLGGHLSTTTPSSLKASLPWLLCHHPSCPLMPLCWVTLATATLLLLPDPLMLLLLRISHTAFSDNPTYQHGFHLHSWCLTSAFLATDRSPHPQIDRDTQIGLGHLLSNCSKPSSSPVTPVYSSSHVPIRRYPDFIITPLFAPFS